ncbi:hypothetical protein ACCS42_09165 [Rhizobium ruizarguesonis]
MTSPVSISHQDALQTILDAGKWTVKADENLDLAETLPVEPVKAIIKSYPADPRSIGLLSLAMGAGKWGIDKGDLPPETDPAKDNWRGPNKANGKHLMSYKTGGVGLPHLDVDSLAKFMGYLVNNYSEIGPASEQDIIGELAKKLRTGLHFAEISADPTFRKWMLLGLRKKDSQIWILEHWLSDYWDPAYEAAHQDVRVALVLSRVWNSASSLGRSVARKAEEAADKVEAVLRAYPGAKGDFDTRRWPWMRRPVALYDMFSK